MNDSISNGASKLNFRNSLIGVSFLVFLLNMISTNVSGEERCGDWGCESEPPILSKAVPEAEPLPRSEEPWSSSNPPPESETLWWQDFDQDGVANWLDNCLLVPNEDQQPAQMGPDSKTIEVSLHEQALQYKSSRPSAMFRPASELGEACSSYNLNWRRTYEAFMLSDNRRKWEIYKFLGEGGPMFGKDTLIFSVPLCSDLNVIQEIVRFAIPILFWMPKLHVDCSNPLILKFFKVYGTNLFWAGKHLYTPSNDGGTITNRFFPFITESGLFRWIVKRLPHLFPGENNTGQTVNGYVSRDFSVHDGREAIVLDWRNVSDAGIDGYSIANQGVYDILNFLLPGLRKFMTRTFGDKLDVEYLIYDQCRGLQEGFWVCTAEIDLVSPDGEKRQLFSEGWMPWQGLDPSIYNFFEWERANPYWTSKEAYNLD